MRRHRPSERPDEQSAKRPTLTRYDLVLSLLPVALLLTAGVAELLGLSTRAALVAWSVVGVVALADALFLNPPRAGGRAN